MVTIRKATSADAVAITRVHVGSWRTTYKGLIPDEFLQSISSERREKMWKEILTDPDEAAMVYVAEDDGEVVGFINSMPERENDPQYTGEVGGIYLLKQAQGQGTGRKLMQTAAAELIQRGHQSMLLWVLRDNTPARKFYEALGGKFLRAKNIEIGGQLLVEIAYGWKDLHILAEG